MARNPDGKGFHPGVPIWGLAATFGQSENPGNGEHLETCENPDQLKREVHLGETVQFTAYVLRVLRVRLRTLHTSNVTWYITRHVLD